MPLSVLTYNVWGIFLAKWIDERMRAIGQRLRAFDVVCLQEQFEARHCDLLFGSERRGSAFPYIERFVSCEYGSGLTIASKYPIVASMFLPFRSCGRPERLNEGDYIANKGIAVVRIAVPAAALEDSRTHGTVNSADTVEVIVCNAHWVAQYEKYASIGGFFNETNAASRLTEAFELGELACLLHGTADQRTPIIICGDFNAGSDSHELRVLHDFCINRGVVLQAALPADQATFSSANSNVDDKVNEAIPIQLDHIFFGDLKLAPGTGQVVFVDKVKIPSVDEPVHLSDHFGVAATFSGVEPAPTPTSPVTQAARQEATNIAAFLRATGDKYASHFKWFVAIALTLFSVASAGWLTTHPFALTVAGAMSTVLMFLALAHRRHESEYYYRVASAITAPMRQ
jgi:endonuclease/exonuclease/phosphatase family metal-dependent hydrolase